MFDRSYLLRILIINILVCSFHPHGEALSPPEEDAPPKIGNFALPTSQQPAGLFAFGGNIIDQDELQLYFFADDFVGKKKRTIDLIPNAVYGITDDLSILLAFPFTPQFKDGTSKSRGLEDFFIQGEYAFFNQKTPTYTNQATVLANVTFPTGSVNKTPPTGNGSPTIFLGGTYIHTKVDWFAFTGQGILLTSSSSGNKLGNQFLYQFGLGRNIPSPNDSIYAWMIELDGQYTQSSKNRGKVNPNSGGNVIYVTPSLWLSTENVVVQFGISLPVTQHLFGKQNKFDLALNLNVAWSFYKVHGPK